MTPVPDPFYTSSAAAHLRWVLEEIWKVTVYVDDQLRNKVAADRNERAIWIPPGLDLEALHQRLSRAWRYIERGPIEVPGFIEPLITDPAVSRGAVVIPLQRPPIERLTTLEPQLPELAT